MNFKFGLPEKCALLIFDQETVKQIGHILLTKFKYNILYVRREIFYLHFRLIIPLLANIFRVYRHNMKCGRRLGIRGHIYFAYLLSWAQLVKPKVILTYIDNDWRYQLLSRIFTKPKYIAIQNGVRCARNLTLDVPPDGHPASKISMPLLYCFGAMDIVNYSKHGHRIDRHMAIGSIKFSWFRGQLDADLSPKAPHNILLVSQWVKSIMQGDTYTEQKNSIQTLCDYLVRLLSEMESSFAIALRTEDDLELSYYRNIFGSRAHFISRNSSMSSYYAAENSNLLVSMNSTLALEFYGFGKKVLFANFTESEMYEIQVDDTCYIGTCDYELFKVKVQRLMSEPTDRFTMRTEVNRQFVMSNVGQAHLIVEDHLTNILEEGT